MPDGFGGGGGHGMVVSRYLAYGTLVAGFAIDRRSLAAVTFAGMVFDVLGGLYLAYELLGERRNSFLRYLTRILTYGVVFGIPAAIYGYFTGTLVAAVIIGLSTSLLVGVLASFTYALIRRGLIKVAEQTHVRTDVLTAATATSTIVISLDVL